MKIGDMNVSKKLNQGNLKTQIGTPYYMAPEIWEQRPYNSSCDIWSLGCMIYELCCLRPPFVANDLLRLKRAIVSGRYPMIPNKYSADLGNVVASMLKVNPANRASAAALLKSPAVQTRLHLEGTDPGTARSQTDPSMLKTIHAPRQMVNLSSALPKPCYPDTRPNSPGAWTVEEQTSRRKQLEREAADKEDKEERKRRMEIPDTVEEDEQTENLAPSAREGIQRERVERGDRRSQGKGKQVWFRENTRDEQARRQQERNEKESPGADEDNIRNYQRQVNQQQGQRLEQEPQQPRKRVHAVPRDDEQRSKQEYILKYKQKKALQDFRCQHEGRSPAEEREVIRAKQQRGHRLFPPI